MRILKRDELDPEWEPRDRHPSDGLGMPASTSCALHEKDGISLRDRGAAEEDRSDKAEAVKDLAYCLYDICANKRQDAKEATAYNALIADWSDLTREAAAIPLSNAAAARHDLDV